MKKILLSSLALATAISVNAQDYVLSNGFKEDFLDRAKTEDVYSDREIFWYGCGVIALPTDAECNEVDHQLTRNGDGDLTIATYKPNSLGNWSPVGFSLANGAKDQLVDVSANNQVSVSYTNTSDKTVEVYWTFTSKETPEADQKLVMADETGTSFGGVINSGDTKDITFQLNTGTRTSWELSEEGCEAVDGVWPGNGKCIWDDGFNSSKLFAVEIAITGEATAETSWAPVALDGETVVFHHILGGDESAVSTEKVVAAGLNIFPNPATDLLKVQFESVSTTTVELTDLTGKVVDSEIAQAGSVSTSFTTADINAGIYFVNIKNAVGTTTQKVVVK
tara:strand:+ start:160 stop:1167 length:1008 start_codon:yes stop_codon:yes gene_type:complete